VIIKTDIDRYCYKKYKTCTKCYSEKIEIKLMEKFLCEIIPNSIIGENNKIYVNEPIDANYLATAIIDYKNKDKTRKHHIAYKFVLEYRNYQLK